MVMVGKPGHTGAESVPAGRVECDLRCVRCGYNLRTLAWDGRCPECGTAVVRSGMPVALRFASLRCEGWFRVGIGLFAVSLLLKACGVVVGSWTYRFIFTIPVWVALIGHRIWAYSPLASGLAGSIAVMLVVQNFGPKESPVCPRRALAATALALLALVSLVVGVAFNILAPLPRGLYTLGDGAWYVSEFSLALCYALMMFHIVGRIGSPAHKHLRRLILVAGAAWLPAAARPPAMAAYGVLLVSGWMGPTGSPEFLRWQAAGGLFLWWEKNVEAACGMATLVVLLLLLRVLARTERRPV